MKRIVYVWVCKFLNIDDWSSLDFCQFWFLLYAVLCMNEDAFKKYTLKFLKFAVLFVSRFDLNLLKKIDSVKNSTFCWCFENKERVFNI